jgi:hypothetical protein
MDPSTTCHHGKDPDVHAEAEAMEEAGALIREHAQDFRGFKHTHISLQRLLPHKTRY